jgi:CheY-like chemotaxis protein
VTPASERPPVVALINSTPDIVEMLRIAFEHAGFVVVSTFTYLVRSGDVDLEAFMKQHQPQAIVYDIAPPYSTNWNLFRHLSQLPALHDRPIIITSTNPARLQQLAEVADHTISEIVETPYVLNELINKVRQAIDTSRTGAPK